jgi:uncharacterized membrane protein
MNNNNSNNFTAWALSLIILESVLLNSFQKYMRKKNAIMIVLIVVSLFLLFLNLNIQEAKDAVFQSISTSCFCAWIGVILCVVLLGIHFKMPDNFVSKTILGWNAKTSYVFAFTLIISLTIFFSVKTRE